jgi:hypothetical protein
VRNIFSLIYNGHLKFKYHLTNKMLPAENGDEEEQCGNDPSDCHHPEDLISCAPAPVFGGNFDRAEAVNRDKQNRVL